MSDPDIEWPEDFWDRTAEIIVSVYQLPIAELIATDQPELQSETDWPEDFWNRVNTVVDEGLNQAVGLPVLDQGSELARKARYRILGSIEVDGNPISSPQERRLLALLLLSRNNTVSVGRAQEVIWGTNVPTKAKGALQSKISRLRSLVGNDQIRFTEMGYVLDVEPGECDADQFEATADVLTRQDLRGQDRLDHIEEALGLWRGDFLGEMANEAFVDGEAVRLEQRRLAVNEDRVATLLGLGRLDGALAAVDPLSDAQPFNDRLCELRMEALARSGRTVDALRVFEQHRKRLKDEVGLTPTSSLAALERRILDGQLSSDPLPRGEMVEDRSSADSGLRRPSGERWNQPIVTRPTFVAREGLVASIRRTLLEGGSPNAMLILGDGGIGKTRLVMQAAQMAHSTDRSVTLIRCRDRPAGAFTPLVHLGEAPDGDWRSSTARERNVSHYTDTLRSKLTDRSMIIVEDLHWADQGTLEVLESLVTAVTNDDADVVFLVTSRSLVDDEQIAAWQSRFVRDLPTVTIELEGLREPEIFQLIERACEARPDANLSDQLFDHTAGNPLLALTGLHDLRSQGALRFDGQRLGTTTGAFTTMPADLAGSLDRILGELDDDTQRLLQDVSASVTAPTLEQLPPTESRSADRTTAAIDRAERAGLLTYADGRLQMRHELFSRVIIDRLTSKEQHALHFEMFLHRQPDDASPEEAESHSTADLLALAHHAERAGPLIDAPTRFQAYEQAAHRSLTITDWPRAAHFFRAAQLMVNDVQLSKSERLRLDTFTGMALFRSHDADSALPILNTVIETAEGDDGELWGLALADHQRAEFTLTNTVPRPARDRIERFVGQNLERDPTQCSRLLSLSAEHHFSYGDNATAAELAGRATQIADGQNDRLLNAEVTFAAGLVALGDLSLREAADRFQTSARLADEVGSGWTASWGLGRVGFVRLLEAEFAAASTAVQSARAVQSAAASWAELSFTAAVDAQLAFVNDDSDAVTDATNEAERLLYRTGFAFTAQFLYPLLLHKAVDHSDVEAFDAAFRRWEDVPSKPPRVFTALRSALAGDAELAKQISELRPLGNRRLGPGHLVSVSAQYTLANLTSDERIAADTSEALEQLDQAGVRYLPAQRSTVSELRASL